MAGVAAWRSRRWGRSIARPTGRSFWIPDSSARSRPRFRGCSGNACKFTAAYIIAHEAGHHIQNLLGILPRVTRLQQQAGSKAEANALQVKVELQADCLSGVWVNREEKKRPGFLEAGDIDAALTTATAYRRRHAAASGDGQGGARLLHPRLRRATQTMVHDRLSAGYGAGLQYVWLGRVVDRAPDAAQRARDRASRDSGGALLIRGPVVRALRKTFEYGSRLCGAA